MRESIGATWIFSICLTFIILFTAYLAISVNYAKAFRIKNHIVSTIEENEGYSGDLEQSISTYLISQGYSASGTCPETIEVDGTNTLALRTDWDRVACINGKADGRCGVCIYQMPVTTGNDDICAGRSYYKVIAFFKFDLPVVNFITTFKVSGDSRYIYDFASSNC